MIYKCGCEASGDNVANYCPIHGDAEMRVGDHMIGKMPEKSEYCSLCGASVFPDEWYDHMDIIHHAISKVPVIDEHGNWIEKETT